MADLTVNVSETFQDQFAQRATLDWFALAVMPRHEKNVTRILHNKGYETFLPLYSKEHKYSGRVRSFQLPLFPGYVFSRFDATARLPILTTPGVLQVMGVGKNPVAIAESEIAAIRRTLEAGFPLSPVSWKTGQRGRITTGPLTGVEGVVESVKPLRLVLSIGLLQRSVLLEIDADCVRSA